MKTMEDMEINIVPTVMFDDDEPVDEEKELPINLDVIDVDFEEVPEEDDDDSLSSTSNFGDEGTKRIEDITSLEEEAEQEGYDSSDFLMEGEDSDLLSDGYQPTPSPGMELHTITDMEFKIKQKEHARLLSEKKELLKRIEDGQSGGDTSENADLSAALNELKRKDRQINNVEKFLNSSKIVVAVPKTGELNVLDAIWIYIPDGETFDDTSNNSETGAKFIITSQYFGSPIEEVGNLGGCALEITSPLGRFLCKNFSKVKAAPTVLEFNGKQIHIKKYEPRKG